LSKLCTDYRELPARDKLCDFSGAAPFTLLHYYPETQGYRLEQRAIIFVSNEAKVPPPAETARKASVVNGIDINEKQVSAANVEENMAQVKRWGARGVPRSGHAKP
jgi:hypothetical protein